MVDRNLKGARPANLALEQSTTFRFVLNLEAVKALGAGAVPELLARADEAIARPLVALLRRTASAQRRPHIEEQETRVEVSSKTAVDPGPKTPTRTSVTARERAQRTRAPLRNLGTIYDGPQMYGEH